MTLPVPSEMSAAVGAVLTAAQWNSNVRDGVNFLANPPIFLGTQATAQSLTTATTTAINLDAETVDTYNGHSTVTNNNRYTAQVAGWYLLVGSVSFAPNGTGRREMALRVNGAGIWQGDVSVVVSALDVATFAAIPAFMNVGDFADMTGFQASGGALLLQAAAPKFSFLAAYWIHA